MKLTREFLQHANTDVLITSLQELLPASNLENNPDFKTWIHGIENDIEALKKAQWTSARGFSAEELKALDKLGLPAPRNQRELMTCFLTLRAVVHYLTKKLGGLANAKANAEEIKRELERRKAL